MGGFLGLGRGIPPKKRHAERHGLRSLGAEGSSGARLERFAGRCCPCSTAASHIFNGQLAYLHWHFRLQSRPFEIMSVAWEIRSMLQAWTRFRCKYVG